MKCLTNMYNPTKLIGKIDTATEFSLKISRGHILGLENLVADYGWIGEGFEPILGNRHIRGVLESHGVESLIIDNKGVHGLEKVPEAEKGILEELLNAQYQRSNVLVESVKRGDFEHYNAVNSAVITGLSFGIGAAAIFDIAGLRNSVTETASRLIPGILESSSVSHTLLNKKEGRSHENFFQNAKSCVLEKLSDIYYISKRAPANIYQTLNLFGWADTTRRKLLPQKANKWFEAALGMKDGEEMQTQTHRWSQAQESAPYRGAIGVLALRHLPRYIGGTIGKIAYDLADSLAVFWVNSGNNVQGSSAVYCNLYAKLSDKVQSAGKRMYYAGKELVSDPFQLANITAVAVWYFSVLALRSYGIRPEEQLGSFSNMGAAVEASLIGVDTAAAAWGAKKLVHRQVVIPPNFSTSPINLYFMAHRYGSQEMLDSLKDDHSLMGLASHYGLKGLEFTVGAAGTVTSTTAKGADRLYRLFGGFLHKII